MAIDPTGGVIISGRFGGTLDLGDGTPLVCNSTVDHDNFIGGANDFLASFDGSGNLRWKLQTHGDWVEYNGVAVDAQGDTFAIGTLVGSGGGALASAVSTTRSALLLGVHGNGTAFVSQLVGGVGFGYGVTVGKDDRIAALVGAASPFPFASPSPMLATSSSDDLVVEWADDGTPLGARVVSTVPGAGAVCSHGTITAGADGRLAVAGEHCSSCITIRGSVFDLSGSMYPYVAVLDADGNVTSQRVFGRPGGTLNAIAAPAFTPSGALWLAGYAQGEVDPGTGTLSSWKGATTGYVANLLLARYAAPSP